MQNKVRMGGEFKICPPCGAIDGSYCMFRKDNDIAGWLFIRPACHGVFDSGPTAGPCAEGLPG